MRIMKRQSYYDRVSIVYVLCNLNMRYSHDSLIKLVKLKNL